ncbi:ribonuclease III domain-containing protein [Candidatus Jidaibacter acanthamoebae]|nr:ribonuclease III domain-containing protein [Candidatus Jidaibacter acanthamoeba]
MKATRNNRDFIEPGKFSILERELKYKFNDKALLIEALTKTVANDTKSSQQQHQKTNERLEFLGDRALELAVTSIVLEQNPKSKKGELNNRVSNLVRNDGTFIRCSEEVKPW